MINYYKQRKQTARPAEETLFSNTYSCPEEIMITGTRYSVEDQYVRLINHHGITLPLSLTSTHIKRQSEYMAGRYCAMKSLQAIGKVHIEICINDDGSPCWPTGFTGSITHSKGLAVAAVVSRLVIRLLGIDAEILVTTARAEKLSHAVLRDKEILLRHKHSLPVDWFFTLIFSAKESLYKLLRSEVGHYFGFHTACITALNMRKQSFTIMLTESLSPEFCEGFLFHGSYQELDEHIVTIIYLS